MQNPPRDTRMDNAKFILIMLVILAHCLERFPSTGASGLYNTIYTFHMPLFIFITGYFTNTQKKGTKFFEGVLDLFVVFCIFDFIWILIKGQFSISTILRPQWTLWYLLSTVYWKILIWMFRNVNYKTLISAALLLSLLGGYLPFAKILSIQRTFAFAPFFVLGYVARRIDFDFNRLRTKRLWIPSILLIITTLSTLNAHYSWLLSGSFNYTYFHCNLFIAPLLRLGTLVMGLMLSLCLLAYCPRNAVMAKYGSKTLFFYIYHTFMILGLEYVLDKYHVSLPSILCFVIVLILLLVSDRISFLHKLINPCKTLKGSVIKVT